MGTKALMNRLDKIAALEAEKKALEVQINGLKEEIKAHMTSAELDELTVGDYIVRYKATTSNKFDSTAFKKAHSKLYAMFCNPSTSMRFTIN